MDDLEILQLIEDTEENDFLDYKKETYSKDKKYDFVVDILSMANSIYNGDKYIIVGVEDIPGSERKIVGIEEVEDQEHYQTILDTYVEPRIKFEYKVKKIHDLQVGVFVILHDNIDKPYMIKKEL